MTLDPSAFDTLYADHASAVYRSALGIVRDPDAAADVVQETFVRAYTATDEIVSPAAWLATVARRLALNELRRRSRLTGLVEDAMDDDEPAGATLVESAVWTDPEKSAASNDSVAGVAACLADLRPDDRTLLTFRYGEGLEIGAIADLLGRTVNATTVALHRARSRFDAAYAERVFTRPALPASCRAWRADAVAHADGKPASAEYLVHLASCAPCTETDADLRSRSKAFALAPLLGLPLVVPATLKAGIVAGLAAHGIVAGASGAAGAAAAGTAGAGVSAATGSAAAAGGGSMATGAFVTTGISAKVAVLAIAGVMGIAGLSATVGPMLLAKAASSPSATAAAVGVVATQAPSAAAAVAAAPTGDPAADGPFVGIAGATAITAGGGHTCALLSSGTVTCWGWNQFGQLGDGTTTARTTPVSVVGISGATAITVGASHTCALLPGGTVTCWGVNGGGQLGDGTTTDSTTPVTVLGITGATVITAGVDYTCALLAGGTVRCWGNNQFGQLGDGTITDSTTPVPVPVSVVAITGATAITAGAVHTCALFSGGTVRCWGLNGSGELGDGTTTDSATPVTVRGF